ncbi:ATP-grasp domain-containing protein [Vibrio fluminensis]|uniref:ATP-binding protein n=1 Tax=Vibrio fluminensis TaxID=2783614 RepID=UPI0018899447|nr:ATP-grasp domain-containing protein [Vibrio fluminensis]
MKKNSECTPKRKNPVVIFGDNISAMGVIRGLRELEVDIYIVSDSGTGLAKYSRYVCDVFVLSPLLPDYAIKITEWIKSKFELKPILMVAGNDDALMLLSQEYDLLCTCAIPTFPEWSVVNSVINKEIVNSVASDIGVPVIKTTSIKSYSELEFFFDGNSDVVYPLFLKCSLSRQFVDKYGTKGVICNDKNEVINAYHEYDGFLGCLLIQDFLPGDIDEISAVLLVLNKESEVVSVASNNKIRAAIRYGSTTLSSSYWHQKMVGDAIKLAEKSNYVGFVGVQFKYDPRSDDYKFLEINGRFSVSVSLAQRCGINMSEMVYDIFTGGGYSKLKNVKRTHKDNILLWFPLSDVALIFQKRFYKSPLKYLSSLKGSGYIIEPFSIKDPQPLLFELVKLISRPFRRLIGYLKSTFF